MYDSLYLMIAGMLGQCGVPRLGPFERCGFQPAVYHCSGKACLAGESAITKTLSGVFVSERGWCCRNAMQSVYGVIR